jgi:hypothetical protein
MLLRPHSQRTYTPRTHWQQQLLGAREYYPRAKLERKGQSNHQSERVGALECERVGSQAPKQQRSPATSSSSSGSQRPRHGSTSLSNKPRKRERALRTALHCTTLRSLASHSPRRVSCLELIMPVVAHSHIPFSAVSLPPPDYTTTTARLQRSIPTHLDTLRRPRIAAR